MEGGRLVSGQSSLSLIMIYSPLFVATVSVDVGDREGASMLHNH